MKSIASGNETNAIFAAGVIQGVALVTFPAAGTIFTSPAYCGLLPLTISFGQKNLPVMAAAAAGFLIALYQMGYGIAAFGVGALVDNTGLALNRVFGLAAVVALALGTLSFAVLAARVQTDSR
jgi:hypothetical protein